MFWSLKLALLASPGQDERDLRVEQALRIRAECDEGAPAGSAQRWRGPGSVALGPCQLENARGQLGPRKTKPERFTPALYYVVRFQ